ncbi:MAG TPA: hypothetical protein VNK26_07870, partial [Pyrinomonadaceae bacterium]|nr:hypothetical protein [Pyrinomonadaceae bacterium]
LFTSRAEARLTLRHDNADRRLTPIGKEIGLVDDTDWERFNSRRNRLSSLSKAMSETRYTRSSPQYAATRELLGGDLGDAFTLSQLALRQNVTPELIRKLLPNEIAGEVSNQEISSVLADELYAGYIEKQKQASERVNHFDSLRLPESMDFREIRGLSNEMIERLERARPSTFGQVRTISGLTPAAISAVLVHLTAKRHQTAA